jgi:hypothetical protein
MDNVIAIEIKNNTHESACIQFLGMDHVPVPKGITIRNIIGDTLYDDGNLLQLRNHIMAGGIMKARGTMFKSSFTYGGFGDKIFAAIHYSITGNPTCVPYRLSSFYDPRLYDPQVIKTHWAFLLDRNTSFSQSNILPGETFYILFYLDSQSNPQYDSLIANLEAQFEEEEISNYLITI